MNNISYCSSEQWTCEITLRNNQNILLFSEDDHFQILLQVRTPWTAGMPILHHIRLKDVCYWNMTVNIRDQREGKYAKTPLLRRRYSILTKRDNRGRIFGSGNTSLAACWRTGSRRGPPCAHPQSVPHGSALPAVEPLRQSVAFFPFAWVFFYRGGRRTYLKNTTLSSYSYSSNWERS
jgi:hypothetical protein